MNENKRRSLTLIIITIATLVLVVGMATYAYFATTRDINNVINANVGTAASMYSFSATSNGNIEMNILFNEMSQANVSTNVLKTDNATIDVSLASPTNDMKTTCTYDIVWVWDSNENNRYTTPDMTLPSTIDNKTYNYEFSSKVDDNDEKDLSKYPTSRNKVTLQKGASIESSSTTATEKQHKIEAYIYNLPVEQTALFGKSFKAHITIDNLNCNMESIESPYHTTCNDGSAACTIAKLYTVDGENDLYYHDGKGNYTNANLEAGDNSYRYAGSNPDNYVCFKEDANEDGTCADDNLYRIIGVIDGKAKLIKYTDINTSNTLAWNEDGDNTWEGSTLETYLNSEEDGGYLRKLGVNKANLIEMATWSVGGFTDSQSASENAKGIYIAETTSETKLSNKKIGLMYVSEYMYAAKPTYWDYVAGNNSTNGYNLSKGNDWLYSSDFPWTISRISDDSGIAFYVDGNGYVSLNLVDDNYYAVHPSFSLSSDAIITIPTGEDAGSKSAPYIINGKTGSGTTLAQYWNDDFGGKFYPHPNTPSTTYGSVAQLQAGYSNFANRPIYIKTTDTEHQVCLYYNNREFCLGAGFWETDGTLESVMAEALEISESDLSCHFSTYVGVSDCDVGDFTCYAESDGSVYCTGDYSSCYVNSDGNASCAVSSEPGLACAS